MNKREVIQEKVLSIFSIYFSEDDKIEDILDIRPYDHDLDPAMFIEMLEETFEFENDEENSISEELYVSSLGEMIDIIERVWEEDKSNTKSNSGINKQDGTGKTLLHIYCQDERPEAVKQLVEQSKADIYIKDWDGLSAIYQAINYGNVKTTEYLVSKYGPDYSDDERKYSLLHAAVEAEKNNEALIDVILAAGGTIDIKDSNGVTPLLYAISYLKLETLKHLLRKGARKDIKVNHPNSDNNSKVTIEKVTDIYINEFEMEDDQLQIMKKMNEILKSY